MTGIRTSAVFKYEKKFGEEDPTKSWMRLPAKTNIAFNPTNNAQELRSVGSKFFETIAPGMFTGSFTINTTVDYSYIQILPAVFEDYSYSPTTKTHTFKKADGKMPKSISMRYKQLNRVVGGDADETTKLVGMVINTAKFSQDASAGSPMQLTLSGVYAWQDSDDSPLPATDFIPFSGDVTQFACLQVPPGEDVANVEKLDFQIANSMAIVPNICSRMGHAYYEGPTKVTGSFTVYGNRREWWHRFYSGGFDKNTNSPMAKGLRPIPEMAIVSNYSGDLGTDFRIYDSFINTLNKSANDGQKMVDAPSFMARNVQLSIKNNVPSLDGILS